MLYRLFVGFLLLGLGALLGAVMLNVYVVLWSIVEILILGIDNEATFDVVYWICLTAGFLTSGYLMLKVWRSVFPKPIAAGTDP